MRLSPGARLRARTRRWCRCRHGGRTPGTAAAGQRMGPSQLHPSQPRLDARASRTQSPPSSLRSSYHSHKQLLRSPPALATIRLRQVAPSHSPSRAWPRMVLRRTCESTPASKYRKNTEIRKGNATGTLICCVGGKYKAILTGCTVLLSQFALGYQLSTHHELNSCPDARFGIAILLSKIK